MPAATAATAAVTWLPITAGGLANQVTSGMPSAACTYWAAHHRAAQPVDVLAAEAGIPQRGDARFGDQRTGRHPLAVTGVGGQAHAGDGPPVLGRGAAPPRPAGHAAHDPPERFPTPWAPASARAAVAGSA